MIIYILTVVKNYFLVSQMTVDNTCLNIDALLVHNVRC